MHAYRKALFIFRRDLRLDDNSALIAALRQSGAVLTVFIADERLLKPERTFANAFLGQALASLQGQIQQRGGELCVLAGDALACVEQLIDQENIDAIFTNRDYTPYARKRDDLLKQCCAERGIAVHSYADQLLLEPEQALKRDGTPYTVFTPFYRNAAQFPIAVPRSCPQKGWARPERIRGLSIEAVIPVAFDRETLVDPEQILHNSSAFRAYEQERNFPALDKTTHLSAHLKFGSCSVRQVYHSIKKAQGSDHALLRALFWRDFFTHIAWHFPYVFGQPFRRQYQTLQWSTATAHFAAWREGRTGFPIVDAGMRELNATGFMHNRVRMIVASFLVKQLHINWQRGERYFSEKLVDYDPGVNNGNWQWTASTGCDAQPWFRIFNPWLQQKKFDPECDYIKTWVPELRTCDISQIHSPERAAVHGYPAPIVHHAAAVAITKQIYGAV